MRNFHYPRNLKKDPVIQQSMPNKTEIPKIVEDAAWEWQSNQNPWMTDELPQWTKYSTKQMQIIEKAFQEKKETVEIGDYVINFECFLQVQKEQNWKVRPVRRTEMRKRATRFCSELITPRTFSRVTYTGDPTIVEKWLKKRKFNFQIDKYGYNITEDKEMSQLREVVALAIKGILEEGQKGNWGGFAEILAKRLEDSISQNPRYIFRECIYLYTDDNKYGLSLYTVVNRALREIDCSKVETLGPYCYLLNFALKALSNQDTKFFHTGKVYRGLGLEAKMLEMYKTAWNRGLQISFHSFVSTSKSEDVATKFCYLQDNPQRVLLVIENLGGAYIETLTSHCGEEEVLLPASRGFQITNIDERNPEMITIHLKMVNTKLNNLDFDEELLPPILSSHSSFTELPPSLSQWANEKKIYFEINHRGENITPENKSLQLKEFVELAAEGICKLFETQGKEKQRENGREIADQLVNTMKKEPSNIFNTMINIYYKASFWKEIHMDMRSESFEKFPDLAPYCYLLNSYLIALNKVSNTISQQKNPCKFVTLYRVSHCPSSHMDVFKELYEKKLHLAFSCFTPTTSEIKIARKFLREQTVLLVLSVPQTMASAFDFSKVAPVEREVLLPPNVSFKITEMNSFFEVPQIKLEFIDYVI